jgi:serine-type D-Ala-D-Ala carboxypeptidase/endopeptidase (penicillin-binding protein 4)
MKPFAFLILFMLIAGLALPALSFGAPPKRKAPKPPAATPLERMFKAAGEVGIRAVSLSSGQVLFEYHPNDPLIPASLVKILTSCAALKGLGPDHRFNTSVWVTSDPQGREIPGDIWIRSEGDIFLTEENALALARKVKDLGINTIRGGVYADGSFFRPEQEKICLNEKCSDTYNPMVSGTAFEFNSIVFRVLPGLKPGSPLRVEWSPPGDYVRLSNLGVTGSKSSKTPVALQPLAITGDGGERYQLSGRMPLGMKGGREFRFSVNDPAGFVARTFKSLLSRAGVEVRGASAMGDAVPPGAKKLATYESAPLGDTLYGLNRYSNNFMAEMLLRSLGASAAGVPGTMGKGLVEVGKMLVALGVPEGEFLLDSGSGLSRVCRVSPRAFCTVLENACRDPSVSSVFLSSLAVNAQAGTLRKRLRSSAVTLHGKTGTLGDVVAFAGYISAPGKDTVIVTVILNGVRDLAQAKEAVDSFLEETAYLADSR